MHVGPECSLASIQELQFHIMGQAVGKDPMIIGRGRSKGIDRQLKSSSVRLGDLFSPFVFCLAQDFYRLRFELGCLFTNSRYQSFGVGVDALGSSISFGQLGLILI